MAGEVVFRVPSLDIPDPERALAPTGCSGTSPSRSSSSARPRRRPGSRSTRTSPRTSPASASAWTGYRSRSSSPPADSARLSPSAIAERLDDRFRILRHGSHAAPTRQQTLTATLQWSHDLLQPDEEMLFRRLAVFAGGFALEAVEQVCAGDGLDVCEGDRRVGAARREVARRGRRGRQGAPLPSARDGPHVRARAARRVGRGAGGRRSPRLLGPRPGGAGTRIAAARLGGAERARGAPHTAPSPARGRPPPLCCAAAVLAAADRARGGEASVRSRSRRGARSDDVARGGATRRRCDRLPQRHASPTASLSRRAVMPSRSSWETGSTSGARCSSSASSGSRVTRSTWRCSGSSRLSTSRAARASPPRRRSGSTRSASRAGSSATCRAPTSSWPRASSASALSRAPRTRSRRRSTSRRSG